jgi:hypothetical protein
VDGSTLAALRKKPHVLREREGVVLAGQIRVLVDACSHDPRWQL